MVDWPQPDCDLAPPDHQRDWACGQMLGPRSPLPGLQPLCSRHCTVQMFCNAGLQHPGASVSTLWPQWASAALTSSYCLCLLPTSWASASRTERSICALPAKVMCLPPVWALAFTVCDLTLRGWLCGFGAHTGDLKTHFLPYWGGREKNGPSIQHTLYPHHSAREKHFKTIAHSD